MNKLIIFTHIPKTSGTSFMRTVVEPNILSSSIYRYRRISDFIHDNLKQYTVVAGHVPYGLHHFTNRKVEYITFLRDPIDRAVSFYYFIKAADKNIYKHPLRDYADSVTLKEFYENRKFQNQQTRFIAGFFSDRLYPIVSHTTLEKQILKSAINNLKNNYTCFGILEEFEKSNAIFQKKFGWKKTVKVAPQKRTGKRPKISELDHETLQSLRQNNSLDLQLYEFACKHFDDQYLKS